MKSHKFTRQELYDLVWQSPMTKLSKQVGLSDQGLAKLCKRNEIPIPPRGHWAKLAAGKPSPQTPLPPASSKLYSDKIVITEHVKADKEPPAIVTEVLSEIETPEITVSKSLRNPHPLVQRWLDEREVAIQREKRLISGSPIPGWSSMYKPFTKLEQRRHRIMDAIFKALEKNGYEMKSGNTRHDWSTTFEGIAVEFNVTERQKQIKIPLTKEEQLQSWNEGKTHRRQLQPCGYLMLNIKTYLPKGLKSRWIEDEATPPLEELVPDIVKTLLAAGPVLVQQRKEQDERNRRYEEERRKVQLEQQRLKIDRECWERFLSAVEQSLQVNRVNDFLAQIRQMTAEQDSDLEVAGMSVGQWVEWAEEWAEKHDPLSGGLAKLFDRVSKPRQQSYWIFERSVSDT
jgi:hypothetical protein